MKILLITAITLLLLACGGNNTSVLTDDQSGTIIFKVQPTSAIVYVDDQEIGPVREYNGTRAVLKLDPGKHIITLKKEGYKTEEYKVYLSDSQELIESEMVEE
jgi:hypothetical protein